MVDFKTDAELSANHARYQRQAQWYAYALSRLTGLPVGRNPVESVEPADKVSDASAILANFAPESSLLYLMFSIIGIIVVFGAIVGGYLMEHGKLLVLMQPAELVIIFGAAVGRSSL